MVMVKDWKLIRSIFDGHEELYRLPDEQQNLIQTETLSCKMLSKVAREWIGEDDYWILYAHGAANFGVTVVAEGGEVINEIPFGPFGSSGACRYVPDSRSLVWSCNPGTETAALYFQTVPVDAPLVCDILIDAHHEPEKLFIGPNRNQPRTVPFHVQGAQAANEGPIEVAFHPDKPGLYLFHHKATRTAPFPPAPSRPLDDDAIRELKSLGYLR